MPAHRAPGVGRSSIGALILVMLAFGCSNLPAEGVATADPSGTRGGATLPTAGSTTVVSSASASAAAASLVGTWQEVPPPPGGQTSDGGAKPHDPGASAYRFWPDGVYEYVRTEGPPRPSETRVQGRYQVDGGLLRLAPSADLSGPAPEAASYRMTIAGDRLVLTMTGATVTRTYVRAED